MKSCLSYNQAPNYLKRCDEIKISWSQRHLLPHISEEYPDKTLILQHIFMNKNFDLQEIIDIFNEIDSTLILCVGNLDDCYQAARNDIPFYYAFPISLYQELNTLTLLNPEYIIPGPPLFFDMPALKKNGIPIRLFPNIGNLSNMPLIESAHGTWIRPEDLGLYEFYADAYEFVQVSKAQEQALFRIYHDQKTFPGPLGLLIKDIREDYSAYSDLITQDYMRHRLNCKQKCESKDINCRICQNALRLANPKRLEYLTKVDKLKNKLQK